MDIFGFSILSLICKPLIRPNKMHKLKKEAPYVFNNQFYDVKINIMNNKKKPFKINQLFYDVEINRSLVNSIKINDWKWRENGNSKKGRKGREKEKPFVIKRLYHDVKVETISRSMIIIQKKEDYCFCNDESIKKNEKIIKQPFEIDNSVFHDVLVNFGIKKKKISKKQKNQTDAKKDIKYQPFSISNTSYLDVKVKTPKKLKKRKLVIKRKPKKTSVVKVIKRKNRIYKRSNSYNRKYQFTTFSKGISKRCLILKSYLFYGKEKVHFKNFTLFEKEKNHYFISTKEKSYRLHITKRKEVFEKMMVKLINKHKH